MSSHWICRTRPWAGATALRTLSWRQLLATLPLPGAVPAPRQTTMRPTNLLSTAAALLISTALLLVAGCSGTAASVPAAPPLAATTGSSIAAPSPSAAPSPVATTSLTFQLDWIPNVQHFGPVYADRMGLYKQA